MTPKELRLLASSHPIDVNFDKRHLWIKQAAWALKGCADELEKRKEASIQTELNTAFDKAVIQCGEKEVAKMLLDASRMPRDLDEDPVGYCINRDGFMDLTSASKDVGYVKSRAFAENKWHHNRCIVVPLFARPGAEK